MSDPNESMRSRTILTLVGLLLIVLGVLFLIGRIISADVGVGLALIRHRAGRLSVLLLLGEGEPSR